MTASEPKSLKVGQTVYTAGKCSPWGATGVKVTYATSEADILVIDKVGWMVAKTKGTEYVLVKAGGKTAKYEITIK
ncbi:hypothetical protein [Micromonospora cremea]|uniref:BIG2 domain-containing protein n=1 Tax=Micromonospora cremea TaxID=709881 RepID=A0A1N5U3T7_9ACTN|nr:hypothetical protein [Micromonospora cremea]SIM55443.1 hypothetical protein SAMN04489832_0591 [Micromonospora cremea]